MKQRLMQAAMIAAMTAPRLGFHPVSELAGGELLPAPNEYLTLLDIARRRGLNDSPLGLIEANLKIAPEVKLVPGRPIRGTNYTLRMRTAYARGSFRDGNEGVLTTKGRYTQGLVSCYIFDAQMRADKAVADADERGAVVALAEEAQGATKGAFLDLGTQFYYGTAAGPKGFQGLKEIVDPAMIKNVGGTAVGAQTSAYLAYIAEDGVQFVFGNNATIQMPDTWGVQQVTAPTASGVTGVLTAYVNGMTLWIGLQVPLTNQVFRFKNIDATHFMDDTMVSDAISQFPIGYRPTHLFMTPSGVSKLQKARQAAINTVLLSGAGAQVPRPTESNGVPIVETNSISDFEAVEV